MSNVLAGPLAQLPPGLASTYCDGIASALATAAGESYVPATTFAAWQGLSSAAIATAIATDIAAGSTSTQIAARVGYYWALLDFVQRQAGAQAWMAFRPQAI